MFERIRISALARKGGAVAVIALAMAGLTAGSGVSAGEAGNWVVASAEGAVTIDGKAAASSVAAVSQGPVIESRKLRDFKIKTPYLAAAIKGTTFTVAVDDTGLIVIEVEVDAPGKQ